MSAAFADTFYFLALLNSRDAAHRRAVQYSTSSRAALITSDWVLTEVANALSSGPNRRLFSLLLRELAADPKCRIIAASPALFERGIAFYVSRTDKSWSLTDCISFCVMQDEGLQDALTGDHHFEQAGFTALLIGF